MMKFACFERTVEALYKYVVPKPREKCSKIEQLGVSFVAGYTGMLYSLFILVKFLWYLAGIVCAVVSHPADTIVSKLNEKKDLTLVKVVRSVGFSGNYRAQ
jgi:solute carrier family 25 phosphate transporter 3